MKFRIESWFINLNLRLKQRKLNPAVVTVPFSSTWFEITLKFGQDYTARFQNLNSVKAGQLKRYSIVNIF